MRKCVLFAIAMACIVEPLSGAFGPCYLLNVYHPEDYRKGRSVGVRLFDLKGSADYDAEPLEGLRVALAEDLRKELLKSKFFREVKILASDETAGTELVIDGEFDFLEKGEKWLRLLGARGGAKLRVRGVAKAGGGDHHVVADFECYRENFGGLGGVTGGLWSLLMSDKDAARGNIRSFAKSFGKTFKWVEKEYGKRQKEDKKRKAKAKTKEEIHGASESGDESLDETAGPKEARRWVASRVIKTNRENWMTADVLWLDAITYRAHQLYNSASGVDGVEGEAIDDKDISRGFLLDLEPLRPFENQEVYVVAATLNVSADQEGPFFWNSKEVIDSASLDRVGGPGVKAIQVLEGPTPSYLIERRFRLLGRMMWVSHPVLFIFPTRLPDGTALVGGLSDELRFHTSIDNHPLTVRFELQDFKLSSTDELRLVGTAEGKTTVEAKGDAQIH